MHQGMRRLRGAIGMGVIWAVSWAIFGLLIGVTSLLLPGLPWDAFFRVFDAPLPALAVPGFFGGMLFSVVLGIAGRHRRFDELSLPGFAGLGAIGGLLLSLLPAMSGATLGLWLVFAVPLMVLVSGSATASLALARKGEQRALRGEVEGDR